MEELVKVACAIERLGEYQPDDSVLEHVVGFTAENKEVGDALVLKASTLATELLCLDDGKANFDNILYLQDHGFNVYTLKNNSVPGLYGGIWTLKGYIVYMMKE